MLLLRELSYYQAPQLSHGGGSTRTETAIRLTGMMVLASNCGDTYVDLINCSIRSELGFDV